MTKAKHIMVQGDSLEAMAKIPTHYVDFICADFPYNISNNHGLTKRGDKIVASDFGEWDKFETMEAYFEFVFKNCDEYKRILKPNGSLVLFFSYRFAGWIGYELERRGLFSFRMPIIFNKTNPLPGLKKTTFRSSYEIGLWLTNDGGRFELPKTFNFLEQADMKSVMDYRIGREKGEKQTVHPTEKPERLIARLISIFTNVGDVVLDNFAGSGTTGVAAYRLSRHCISIERDERYMKIIRERQAKADKGL